MTPPVCNTCGEPGRLYKALLREAFSDQRVSIQACTPCGRRAWRTIEQPAPVQIETLHEWPVVTPPARFLAEWVG